MLFPFKLLRKQHYKSIKTYPFICGSRLWWKLQKSTHFYTIFTRKSKEANKRYNSHAAVLVDGIAVWWRQVSKSSAFGLVGSLAALRTTRRRTVVSLSFSRTPRSRSHSPLCKFVYALTGMSETTHSQRAVYRCYVRAP